MGGAGPIPNGWNCLGIGYLYTEVLTPNGASVWLARAPVSYGLLAWHLGCLSGVCNHPIQFRFCEYDIQRLMTFQLMGKGLQTHNLRTYVRMLVTLHPLINNL